MKADVGKRFVLLLQGAFQLAKIMLEFGFCRLKVIGNFKEYSGTGQSFMVVQCLPPSTILCVFVF